MKQSSSDLISHERAIYRVGVTENVNCSKMQQKAPNFINLTRCVIGLVSMVPINWNYLDSIDVETQGFSRYS